MTEHPDSKIIDRLGGTGSVAQLCECRAPSVSAWRKSGIPKARRQFLRAVRPDAFEEATAPLPPPHREEVGHV